MTIREVMKTPVITVSEDASLREAVALMSSAEVSGLPVVDADGLLIGVVTEHDLIKAMLPRYENLLLSEPAILDVEAMQSRVWAIRDNPVSSIMTKNVVSLGEDETVLDAAALMILKRVKRLPIVRDGKPVGIVSRINVIQAVMQRQL